MGTENTSVFRIEAMDCPTEFELLRKSLEKLPGVIALKVDLISRQLSVTHASLEDAVLIAVIAKAGMEAVAVPSDGSTASSDGDNTPTPFRHQKMWPLALSGLFALTAEVVTYNLNDEKSPWVLLCAAAAIAIGGRETVKKGWIALRSFTININLLMSVAVIGAVAIGEWPEAAMVVWLFGIAEALEAMSLDRARDAVRKLVTLVPEKVAVMQDNGLWKETPVAGIVIGARARIKPGERIALDGTIVYGRSSVNQAPITGESLPVEKKVGDSVYAGSLNERGTIEVKITSLAGETTLARIAKYVQAGYAQRAPTQRFVDQFARYYTPAVLVAAILVALGLPLALDNPWHSSIYMALVLLVVACPCALVISTPVSVASGLAAAARRGILVKGGLYLELGHRLKFLAMDKTGTLTRGTPSVTNVEPLSDHVSSELVLELAASLNSLSEHPVATAIVKAYTGELKHDVEEFESLPGRGVKGKIDDTVWYLGNHRLAEELKICSQALESTLDKFERQAKTAVVLATERGAVAVIAVSDTVRDSSRETVRLLQTRGVKPVMLTGDNTKTAKAVGKAVGIDEIYGDLLPEDKLAAIAGLAKDGVVGMVGDGINDAPALARADIGFAMGAAGTDTAIETADVALMTDDLRKIPEFIDLSNRTYNIMRQNVSFAIAVKAIFFGLTLAGCTSLWLAVFADMGASLIVVGNGLRLLRKE
ncbi:MAG: heavy metal translocating P-type ATPase [Gammaproteobacteria bacterium]|jgi:Zn2+/Cd2+-exporting ATPase|nr:heavy metal translocating P-type ATPase [Gammaproteobacteria bacterium]